MTTTYTYFITKIPCNNVQRPHTVMFVLYATTGRQLNTFSLHHQVLIFWNSELNRNDPTK